MCGIVAYVGDRSAQTIIMDGLKKLEYRGYDSSGVAILDGVELGVERAVGKVAVLEQKLNDAPLKGAVGVGHTRWATHGRPSERNAHPHEVDGVVVVHNGIIENYLSLKDELLKEGRQFQSETDTEIICHLIHRALGEGRSLEEAVRVAIGRLEGSYGLSILWRGAPDRIVGAKKDSPLVVGLGDGENFLASDIPAILQHTKEMVFLDDEEMVVIDRHGAKISRLDGTVVEKAPQTIQWSPALAEKGGYRHFMLKEIFEQPRAVIDSFRGRIVPEKALVDFGEQGLPTEVLENIKRVVLVACGTSYHAALVGKFFIEGLARISVEVDIASEFRYRDPLVDSDTLMVVISQSGETIDTLAALKEGKSRGARTLAICNVVGSSIVRASEGVLYTQAGPEIGVASTKAFTTQLIVLYLLALRLASLRKTLDKDRMRSLIEDLLALPGQMEETLSHDDHIRDVARRYMNATDFLYLGRGKNYPVALEGALKLKEISYIHAEGYPAGEMKHGPIALIDENLPVVVLHAEDGTQDKIMGNIEEVKARKGIVIAVSTSETDRLKSKADEIILSAANNEYLTTVLLTLPMQLLAYHVAVLKGTDVDQPRNLAKSVTVE